MVMVMVVATGVGTALRIERCFYCFDMASQALHHFLNHVICSYTKTAIQ